MTIKLNKKQAQICTHLINGKNNVEIAKLLKMSRHTVKAHISDIINNYNISNRTELAYRLGRENFVS